MFDKRASLEFKKILECQKERVVKCDVEVYRAPPRLRFGVGAIQSTEVSVDM